MRNGDAKGNGTDDLLDQLLPLELDDDSRRALAAALRGRIEPKGAVLVREGEANDLLWFLKEGEVTVDRDWRGSPSHIAALAAPAVFGATTFFRTAAASVTIRTTSDCRLATLDRDDYERLRREHPRAAEFLALATLRALSERFDLLDRRVTEFLARPAGEPVKPNEWSRFRRRLFEDPSIL